MDESKLSQKRQNAKKSAPGIYNLRKRKSKFDDRQPKITSWLNKENGQRQDVKSAQTPDSLGSSVCESAKLNDSSEWALPNDFVEQEGTTCQAEAELLPDKQPQERKTKRRRTYASIEKYGICLPSFEKIMADQEKFEKHKESVKLLDVFDNELLEKTVPSDCLEDKKFDGELLDCRHLSLEDLDDYFSQYTDTLKDIMAGKECSERHNLYHNHSINNGLSLATDLRCSTSTVVFTEEQREHLLDLLSLRFSPSKILDSYFFKVLLPELCLLIFMSVHSMSKQKANAYLDERPLDF